MSRQSQQNDEGSGSRVCELLSLTDLERLYRVKHALEAHGIEALISGGPSSHFMRMSGAVPRLLVLERDLVYARWVAHAAGVDAWPDEPSSGDPRSVTDAAQLARRARVESAGS